MDASVSESKAMTPVARIWKKLKTKHDGIVLVFQPGHYRNVLDRHSDVSHDRYACYDNDAEVLECFVKVTHEALEKAGYKAY